MTRGETLKAKVGWLARIYTRTCDARAAVSNVLRIGSNAVFEQAKCKRIQEKLWKARDLLQVASEQLSEKIKKLEKK